MDQIRVFRYDERNATTHSSDRLVEIDNLLSLLISRPVTSDVVRRETSLPTSHPHQLPNSCDSPTNPSATHPMLRKFVLPEHIVVPLIAHPILVHPSQQVVLSKVLQRRGRDIPSGERFDRLTRVPALSIVGSGDGVESEIKWRTRRSLVKTETYQGQ